MNQNKKFVLITGASTGIGRATAHLLSKAGYEVFAGVRNHKDKESIESLNAGIHGLLLDVTKPEHIQNAFDEITKKEMDAFSVINNAGIAVFGPVETLPLNEFRRQFEVNFFGLIEVTQKFLPLLREKSGRIVNISSVSGRRSSPFLGAYSASKFALEAISDSLRWELLPSGIKVILIEPGPIATPIWQKGLSHNKNLDEIIPKSHKAIYGSAIERALSIVNNLASGAIPPEEVSRAVVKVLTLQNPPSRLLVASYSSRFQLRAAELLPSKILDKLVSKALYR